MIDFDDVTKENIKNNNRRSHILDHSCRILIIGGSGSGTKTLLYLIKQQDKIMKLIKFIYILRIKLKQYINISLKRVIKVVLRT